MKASYVRDNTRYTFCFSDTGKDNFVYLSISAVNLAWENVFKIPIKENSAFAYKINKRSISSAGGAYGFMRFVKDCIDNDFCMCFIYQIVKAVSENMRCLEVYTG